MTTSSSTAAAAPGARALLIAAGLAVAGWVLAPTALHAQQEEPLQGEVLLPGPMLLGGAAVVPGASGQDATGENVAAGEHGGMAGHGDHGAASPEPVAAGPADAAFQAAMDRMHQDMVAVATTGDPDVDFARAMIPHHQGAIDMAKAVIAHGKDPEIKRLAEEVVSAQEREIAQMNEWLLKQGR